MFSVRFTADAFLDHIKQVQQVYELIGCVRRANENAGNLISVVQFLINLLIYRVSRQIVGLTASLGTGKAKSREKAKEHIILVSANLDAAAISTVKENREELEKYVNIPLREAHFVPKDEQDPFEKIISKVIICSE